MNYNIHRNFWIACLVIAKLKLNLSCGRSSLRFLIAYRLFLTFAPFAFLDHKIFLIFLSSTSVFSQKMYPFMTLKRLLDLYRIGHLDKFWPFIVDLRRLETSQFARIWFSSRILIEAVIREKWHPFQSEEFWISETQNPTIRLVPFYWLIDYSKLLRNFSNCSLIKSHSDKNTFPFICRLTTFLHSHRGWEGIGFMWKMTFEIFIKSLRFETPWVRKNGFYESVCLSVCRSCAA